MVRDNKGITLASLVITIIILLIIVSVATVSGVGAVNYIKFNNAKAQFQTMQSQVNSWYEQSKNDASVLSYGRELTEADATIKDQTLNGRDSTDYRYFKSDDIKDILDIDGISYDFLINIKERSVLLFGGITYQDKTYYSAEDFEVNNVEYEQVGEGDRITFTPITQDNTIIIYNIIFPNEMSISKYNVQYQLPGTTNWVTLTSDKKGEYIDVDAVAYSDAWTIETTVTGTYKVRITTVNEDIKSEEQEVTITTVTSE